MSSDLVVSGDPLSSHGLEFLSIDDYVLSNSHVVELSSSSPPSSSFLSSSPCSQLSYNSTPGHQIHGLGAVNLYPRLKFEGVDQSPDAVSMDRADLISVKRSSSSQSLDHEPGHLFTAPPFYSPCVPNSTTMTTHIYMRNLNDHGVSDNRLKRKVWSTGDLQQQHTSESLGPAANAIPIVGRYSFEQRKERINRYRSKKTQRNFNRTIKYTCRKILAEKRTRISGRFARNDDTENCKVGSGCQKEEEEEDELLQLWADRFLREEKETDWPAISSFGFPSSTDIQFG